MSTSTQPISQNSDNDQSSEHASDVGNEGTKEKNSKLPNQFDKGKVRDKLKARILQRVKSLTSSEKKYLEDLLAHGTDHFVERAEIKLSDDSCFEEHPQLLSEVGFTNRRNSFSSRSSLQVHGRPSLTHFFGSERRIEVLKDRSKSEVHEKLWRAHEGGIRVSDTSSRHSINRRDVEYRDFFRRSGKRYSIRQKSQKNIAGYGDEVFRPDPPKSDCGPSNATDSIEVKLNHNSTSTFTSPNSSSALFPPPPIGHAQRLRSESSISLSSKNSARGRTDSLTKSDPSVPLTLDIKGLDIESNKPPLPHLPFIRNRSTSSQKLSELQQKRPIYKRITLRQSSVGNEVEMSLEVPNERPKPSLLRKRSSSIISNSGKIPLLRKRSTGSTIKMTRSSSISSIGSSYLPSSYDDHDFLARSFVLDASKRQDSSDLLSNLLLPDKETSLSDTELRPDLSDEDSSWDKDQDIKPEKSFDVWNVSKDDYAEGYGGGDTLPFFILGTSADDESSKPHVLSPPLMESLQNFLPYSLSENNFWLKYSLIRDGASLHSLLQHVRGSKNTILAIESVDGEVFGSFTSSHWTKSLKYYGSGESFLWRMRKPRTTECFSIIDQAHLESELDVYNWTGHNTMIQSIRSGMLTLGGGEIDLEELPPSPKGWSETGRNLGFGLSIDSDLLYGSSSPCDTFGNPSLAQHSLDGLFEIANMEIWTLTASSNVQDAEQMEHGAFFLESNMS